jgi:hypothetical protein
MPLEPTRQCPYCRERIPAAATKCRYCREILPDDDDDEDEPPRRSSAIRAERPPPRPRRAQRDQDDEDHAADEDHPRPRRPRLPPGPYADCPSCGCPGQADKVTFTWWGGLVGPAMFTHVRCTDCGTCYNGKSGNYNTVPIAIYIGVSTVVGLGILIAIVLGLG